MPISVSDLDESLRNAFPITHLEIRDESNGCGESYSVLIVSEAFEGKSTLARHRLVNTLLKDQITQMHAFSQKSLTPAQFNDRLAKELAAGSE